MTRHKPPATGDDTEEARAFLQARLTLFWKVLFWFNLAGGTLGLLGGGMVKPGPDTVITFGGVLLSGSLWWLCRRGKRSIRFCRISDCAGVLAVAIVGSFLTRYILVGFVREHSVVTREGALMADGYVVMIDLFPATMFLAIRAALIPSSPRRTVIVTALVGVPKISAVAARWQRAERGRLRTGTGTATPRRASRTSLRSNQWGKGCGCRRTGTSELEPPPGSLLRIYR